MINLPVPLITEFAMAVESFYPIAFVLILAILALVILAVANIPLVRLFELD
jgi:hypothetical protein